MTVLIGAARDEAATAVAMGTTGLAFEPSLEEAQYDTRRKITALLTALAGLTLTLPAGG